MKRNTGLKPRTNPIAKESKKHQKRIRQYRKVKESYFTKDEVKHCFVRRPGCHVHAVHIHHAKGKVGDLLLDYEFFVPVCDGPCHTWLHEHPEEAKKYGDAYKVPSLMYQLDLECSGDILSDSGKTYTTGEGMVHCANCGRFMGEAPTEEVCNCWDE
jgi:hypothetical protein